MVRQSLHLAQCAGSDREVDHPRDTELLTARLAHAWLSEIGCPRVNWLIIGSEQSTAYLLYVLRPYFREPLSRWYPGAPFFLKRPSGGTLILHDLDAMQQHQQLRLLEWLDDAMPRVQVVSTSARSLMPELHEGRFNEHLYYRLNVLLIDVSR
jgi:hypothetical protein